MIVEITRYSVACDRCGWRGIEVYEDAELAKSAVIESGEFVESVTGDMICRDCRRSAVANGGREGVDLAGEQPS